MNGLRGNTDVPVVPPVVPVELVLLVLEELLPDVDDDPLEPPDVVVAEFKSNSEFGALLLSMRALPALRQFTPNRSRASKLTSYKTALMRTCLRGRSSCRISWAAERTTASVPATT